MLDTDTKRRIDTARDILVGKVPDPKSQVEQITIALIYKFMDDMDAEAEELGGKRKFFAGDYSRYGWAKLMRSGLGGHETLNLYAEAIAKMPENPGIPPLFRDIFKNAYLPYRDPETLRAFLKIIDEFTYDHSERLGDAFEYLLSVLGSQGDAGQFRTPRHIIDFIVAIVDPKKTDTVLDPACGTAGFLISAWKHVLMNNTSKPKPSPPAPLPEGEGRGEATLNYRGGYQFGGLVKKARQLRAERTKAEELLWELLRDRQLMGAKFRRQHQLGDYICDFYCDEAGLVVECDGEIHETPEQRTKDSRRDAWMKSMGFQILRFPNDRVFHETESVLAAIATHLPSPLGRGAGGEGSPEAMPGDLLTPDDRGRLAANIRGYDISPDMVRLSLVNLYLHGFTDPHIAEYDTLTSQDKWNEHAEVILANPPFMSPKGGIKPHNRFSVQSKRSEVLFVDYMAEHLTPTGRAGIIVPEGIIFQSQTAYTQLRKMLVEEYLVAVVSLPAGVFNPYSGVKTSILILDKSLAKQAQTIVFFKIENDGFGLGAQRRPIDKDDLPQARAEIAEYLRRLRARESVDNFQPMLGLIVQKEKIAANGDYNLSGERYREGAVIVSAWPFVPVAEVFQKGDDTVLPESLSGPVMYVGLENITQNTGCLEGTVVTESPADIKSLKAVFKPRDLLYGKLRPNLNKVWLADREGICSTDIFVIRAIKGRADPALYAFLFRSARFNDAVMGQLKGAQLPRIGWSSFAELIIPLPPLEVQKEIVAEIEGYQKVIDGARAVLDNYRPHIPIHPNWPMVGLGEVCSFKNGLNFNKDSSGHTVKIIGVSDFQTNLYAPLNDLDEVHLDAPLGEDYLVKAGDILFVRSNGNPDLVGRSVIVPQTKEPTTFSGFTIRGRIHDERALPIFFAHFFKSRDFAEMIKTVGQGANIRNLSQGILNELKIPLPPLATQQQIVAEIEAEQALVAANCELMTRFEKKIQATLARVWGEELGI